MAKKTNPRHGSMGVWPRKRANRPYARIRSWAKSDEVVPLGFAGYKVGMTHVMYTDNEKKSVSKGMEVSVPVTVIECPPLKVAGARAYAKSFYRTDIIAQTLVNADKELSRKTKITAPKNQKIPSLEKIEEGKFDYISLICYTQPKLTSVGKKKPELFEVRLGGSPAEQLAYAKENLGKEISVADVFSAGKIVDAHAITIGKGFQGSVKRFGVNIRASKSEKTRRAPGSISGGWVGQMHMMHRVAFAGQTGYHTRTDFNKLIMFLDSDVSKINPKGGFVRYGEVKNTYILVKGSVPGPEKRLIRLTAAVRSKVDKVEVPVLDVISIESKQN